MCPLPAGTEPPAHTIFAVHDLSPWAISVLGLFRYSHALSTRIAQFGCSLSLLFPKGITNPSWGSSPKS